MNTLDLNLLRIFDALATEGNATRAARRVGLSQPAFSHALKRLRHMLGDPLFVRVPRGMAPTPRATELAPLVRDVLERADRLAQPRGFEPATCAHTFRIATTDYFEHVAFPRLALELQRLAPQATIVSRPTDGDLPKAALYDGSLHLAIAGFFGELPEGFFQQRLFDETFTCVVREGHPVVKKRLSLAQYTKLSHVLISPGGDLHGVVDERLAALGRERHVAVGASSFLSPASIVAESDLILTAPRRLAKAYQRALPLRLVEPPLELPGFTVLQVWHERQHADPAHRWLRQLVARVCHEGEPSRRTPRYRKRHG